MAEDLLASSAKDFAKPVRVVERQKSSAQDGPQGANGMPVREIKQVSLENLVIRGQEHRQTAQQSSDKISEASQNTMKSPNKVSSRGTLRGTSRFFNYSSA